MITGVKSGHIAEVWPEVAPWLAPVTRNSRGRLTTGALYQALRDARMQLWIGRNDDGICAVCITEIVTYIGGAKAFRIDVMTGKDRKDWTHAMDLLTAYAKAQGCSLMEARARKGWVRELTDWQQTHVFIEKEI